MSKTWSPKAALTATAVLLGCVAYSGQAQSQGLFEFLFGQRPPPAQQQQQYESSEPMQMRVQPRRSRGDQAYSGERGERRRDQAMRSKPVQTERRAAKSAVVATPIDPKTNPNWHLIDPTLKRGDVVVLKGQILVYDGGHAPATRDDFATLKETRHLSATERQQIEKIAALPDMGATGPKQTQASLSSGTTAVAAGGDVTVSLTATE